MTATGTTTPIAAFDPVDSPLLLEACAVLTLLVSCASSGEVVVELSSPTPSEFVPDDLVVRPELEKEVSVDDGDEVDVIVAVEIEVGVGVGDGGDTAL